MKLVALEGEAAKARVLYILGGEAERRKKSARGSSFVAVVRGVICVFGALSNQINRLINE
jgi:hypothetical protein